MRWAWLLIACGGCDFVFNLDHLPPVPTCAEDDEDCDSAANADDLCPADPDSGEDKDGDGVGDACDPDLTDNGNLIAYFDGFNDNSGGWAIKSGAWQLMEGTFTQPTPGDSRVEKTVDSPLPSVEVIIPRYSASGNGFISVFGSVNGSALQCSVIHQPDGSELLQLSAPLVPTMQVALPGTGPLRIQGGQMQNNTYYCHARHGDNFDTELTVGGLGPTTIDTIGVATSSASVTVSSITLFEVQ